jgi:hypothetical protein
MIVVAGKPFVFGPCVKGLQTYDRLIVESFINWILTRRHASTSVLFHSPCLVVATTERTEDGIRLSLG